MSDEKQIEKSSENIAGFASGAAFELAQRMAKSLSASTLVPQAFQGNLPNCLIALELSSRIGASPLMVMQNLDVIHGRPSWRSQFLIATVNACGRFTPLRFESDSDDAKPPTRMRGIATDRESGEVCKGPWVSLEMAAAEGWSSKNGSKWKTMPELMLSYRAAAFWTRIYAPELSLGLKTADEVIDIAESPPTSPVASMRPGERLRLRDLRQPVTVETDPAAATEPETEPSK
jgi:hypothetical protein